MSKTFIIKLQLIKINLFFVVNVKCCDFNLVKNTAVLLFSISVSLENTSINHLHAALRPLQKLQIET